MPLPSIVTIVLRLFSLYWVVQGIIMFVSEIARGSFGLMGLWSCAAPGALLVTAVLMFLFSKPLAHFISPRTSLEFSPGGLSLVDLYCFSFVFLGLFFVLCSFANTVNWLHYFFLVMRDSPTHDPHRSDNFYQLTQPLITLVAGGASMWFARRLALRLADIQEKVAGPQTSPASSTPPE